ncbi:penicillin-binding protein 2 [Candidatus Saccharibacteria bacterium]|nr:penicillin-binding protein 2 [Candidatus Saccharibacteria bacterium]
MSPVRTSKLPRPPKTNRRLRFWYSVLILVLALFIGRLFYLQIIKHDYYRQQALSDQQKEYVIPASRGIIEAHSGSATQPLVLNQKLYTLFADPSLITQPDATAAKLADLLDKRPSRYAAAVRVKNSRYQVLATKVGEQLKRRITALKLPGIGLQAVQYRVYPQGRLAAQLLGFVNASGQGSYGIEQYLDEQLAGMPGRLKAVTDVNGVPLAASADNVEIEPKAGAKVSLTIDIPMQKQLEHLLRQGLARASSGSGSAVIVDPHSGAVKAMANWPTYDPAAYYKVTDQSLFNNAVVSSPLEFGSVMKVMTTAAALDLRVIKANTTYFDPGRWTVDGHDITNAVESGPATRSITDVLQNSLNTGATWMLMQMGGGQINSQARQRWHDYLVNHYQFGKPTGIEQGYESGGMVPDPNNGFGLDLTYANMSFGQAMTATPLQMAAALSSIVNGGTYYKPYLVESLMTAEGQTKKTKPAIVKQKVVSAQVSREIRRLMEYMVAHHVFSIPFSNDYSVGGKTGTPEIADPAGGYYSDRFNGTYIGYVGGQRPDYVVVVRVNEPHVGTFAGAGAAQPIFGDIAHALIDNFGVVPKN